MITVRTLEPRHRDRVWKDRTGDYWRWYCDDERMGWHYQSPYGRWRFGAPHCGPFTEVGPAERYADDD